MGGIPKKRPDTPINHVGIELEFLSRYGNDRRDTVLEGLFLRSPLSRCIELHFEWHGCGIHGYEASLCCPETDYKTALREMVSLISANGGAVCDNLGLHVHLDTRNRDAFVMKNAMMNHQAELDAFLTTRRLGEGCRNPNYVIGRDGYNTVEVRMLQATLDISLITRYVDRLIEIVNTPVAAQVQELACV